MTHSITGIAHFGVRIHDLERSRAFYEMLGFEFVAGPVGPEPVAIMDHPSGVWVNFIINADEGADGNVLMDLEPKHAGYTHIALGVADVMDTKAHLESNDVRLSGGPMRTGPGLSIFVRDPDGNVVEFRQADAG